MSRFFILKKKLPKLPGFKDTFRLFHFNPIRHLFAEKIYIHTLDFVDGALGIIWHGYGIFERHVIVLLQYTDSSLISYCILELL